MKRSVRQIVWLLPVVVVLALLAVAQWRHDRASAPGTLLTLDPSAITRIKVAVAGKPVQRYAKRDGHWWQLTPQPVRTDDGRLEDIAAIAAAPVLQWRKPADLDAAKIGLAKPALVLTLNDQQIDYGAIAAFGPQRYVRVGQRIALIGAQYAPRSDQPARRL